jgi:hypothetical protein
VIEDREKDIEEQKNAFDLRAHDLKVVDRARIVRESGLAAKALDILLKSDYAAFGIEGMDLELRLLLTTGQMDRVRAWMEDEQEEVLGSHTYRRNLAHMGAATGDYQAADENFALSVPKYAGITPEPIPARPAAALILATRFLTWTTIPSSRSCSVCLERRCKRRYLFRTAAAQLSIFMAWPKCSTTRPISTCCAACWQSKQGGRMRRSWGYSQGKRA